MRCDEAPPYHGGFLLGVSPILLLFPVEGIQDGAYTCSAATCQAERMQDKHLPIYNTHSDTAETLP